MSSLLTSKPQTYGSNLAQARQQGLWALSHPTDSRGRLVTLPPRHRKRDYILGVFRSSEKEVPAKERDDYGWTWEDCGRKVKKWCTGSEDMVDVALSEQSIQSLYLRAQHDSKPRYNPATSHLQDFSAISSDASFVWPSNILSKDQEKAQSSIDRIQKIVSKTTSNSEYSCQNRTVLAISQYYMGNFEVCQQTLMETHLREWVEEYMIPDSGMEDKKGKRKQLVVTWENLYGFTLRIAAAVLEAFCLERTEKKLEALKSYERMINIFKGLMKELKKIKEDLSTWEEFKRWSEEGFYRFVQLNATTDDQTSLRAHRIYFEQIENLGSDYRLQKRSVIFRSYFRLLLDSYKRGTYIPNLTLETANSLLVEKPDQPRGGQPQPEVQVTPSSPTPANVQFNIKIPAWRIEVEELTRALEMNLKTWTKFPKAGSINRPYLEFLDMCAESWEMGGRTQDAAANLAQIMKTALRYTFHSNRLLRHLIKAQMVLRRYDDCIRSVNLYVQLWTKAKETHLEDVAKTISKLHEAYARREAAERKEEFDEEGEDLRGDESDVDPCRDFVETVLIGLRVQLKYRKKFQEADELMKKLEKALVDFENEDVKTDKELMSRVERVRGIVDASLAEIGDKFNRTDLQKSALAHLTMAASLHQGFANLYHLAFLQTELRDLPGALLSIKVALNLSSRNKDAWHLLALILSAKQEHEEALKIIDSTTDEDEMEGMEDLGTSQMHTPIGGSSVVENSLQFTNGTTPLNASDQLEEEQDEGNPWDFWVEPEEAVESEIQLRFTRNLLVEWISGPEAAVQDQKTIFTCFARIHSSLTGPKNFPYPTPLPEDAVSMSNLQIQYQYRHLSLTSRPPDISPTTSLSNTISSQNLPSGAGSVFAAPTQPIEATLDIPAKQAADDNYSIVIAPFKPVDPKMKKLLMSLWLMSAATFRRAGKTEDCRGAIQEAESIDKEHADVLIQKALLDYANGEYEAVYEGLKKTNILNVDHPDSVFFLAKLYLESVPPLKPSKGVKVPEIYTFPTNNLKLKHARDYAEGMLELATETNAWDYPEMWWLLARAIKMGNEMLNEEGEVVKKFEGETEREIKALRYALELEDTKPIRRLRECVPRIL